MSNSYIRWLLSNIDEKFYNSNFKNTSSDDYLDFLNKLAQSVKSELNSTSLKKKKQVFLLFYLFIQKFGLMMMEHLQWKIIYL